VKTVKYRKWCFDQIQGISEDNKELIAEVDWLRQRLETAKWTGQSLSRKGSMLSSSLVRKSEKGQVTYLSCTPPSTEKYFHMYLCVSRSLL
jgi:hypothetical protein